MTLADLEFVFTLFLVCMGCFSLLTMLFVVLAGFNRRRYD